VPSCNSTENNGDITLGGFGPVLYSAGAEDGSATLQWIVTGLTVGTTYHYYIAQEILGTGGIAFGGYQATITVVEI